MVTCRLSPAVYATYADIPGGYVALQVVIARDQVKIRHEIGTRVEKVNF